MAQSKELRQQRLLNRLRLEQQASIEGLALFLGVSTATIRRDLRDLETRELVILTVGGGVILQGEFAGIMNPLTEIRAIEEKIRIAEYCTELVRDQDDFLIGPGTTTLLAGKIMGGITDRSFRIITNSLELALETGKSPNIRTVILGGEVWNKHSVTSHGGHEYFSECHHHHTLLLSADGVHRMHGVSMFETRLLPTIKEMLSVSDRVILAVDSGKFGQARYNRITGWDRINIVVTDRNTSVEDVKFLKSRKIEVVLV